MEPRPSIYSAHPDKRPLNSSAMQFLVESNNLGYNVGILRVRVRVRVRMRVCQALGGDWRHLHFKIFLPSALALPLCIAEAFVVAGWTWDGRLLDWTTLTDAIFVSGHVAADVVACASMPGTIVPAVVHMHSI